MKKYWSAIAAVAVIVVAFVMHLLVEYGTLDFGEKHNYWFFIFASVGLSIILILRSLENKNKNNTLLIAFCLLALAGVIICAEYTEATVHTILLGVAVLGAILLLLGYLLGQKRTFNRGKNDEPGYKNYFERKAEEEAKPKEEEPPLPELQSFADVNHKDEE